jgi:hypothetical protein
MNDNDPAGPAAPTPDSAPAAQSIDECLAEIERGTESMRAALLARDQEAIMTAVSGQEQLLRKLTELWRPEQQAPSAGADAIRAAVGRIRNLLRRNTVIARTFLDLINGTIESLNARAGGRIGEYDATGRVQQHGVPILLQCQG